MTAAALLLALALLVLPVGRTGPGRRPPPRPAAHQRRCLAVAGAVLGPVLLLAPSWWPAGMCAALAAGAWTLRRPVPISPAGQARHRRELADFCRLLAACLRAGLAPAVALGAALDALWPEPDAAVPSIPPERRRDPGGSPREQDRRERDRRERDRRERDEAAAPATEGLRRVAALCALGADPEIAWNAVASDPDLAPLSVAARRSGRGGSALAGAVAELADRLTADLVAADRARAERAGVLIAAPLGLCFLPAFLCLGLAPVVIGLIGGLGLSW